MQVISTWVVQQRSPGTVLMSRHVQVMTVSSYRRCLHHCRSSHHQVTLPSPSASYASERISTPGECNTGKQHQQQVARRHCS